MTVMSVVPLVTTYALLPFALKAIEMGNKPTGKVLATESVTASMTEMVPSALFTTYA